MNGLDEGISTTDISTTYGNVLSDGVVESDQDIGTRNDSLSITGVVAGTATDTAVSATGLAQVWMGYGSLLLNSDGFVFIPSTTQTVMFRL